LSTTTRIEQHGSSNFDNICSDYFHTFVNLLYLSKVQNMEIDAPWTMGVADFGLFAIFGPVSASQKYFQISRNLRENIFHSTWTSTLCGNGRFQRGEKMLFEM
jgi:hypothetical protein